MEQRRLHQTYRQIAQGLSVTPRLLRRAGVHRLAGLEPARQENCHEHALLDPLLHLDIKEPGRIDSPDHRITGDRSQRRRGIGWTYIHLAIDDHLPLAFAAIKPDERRPRACKALIRTLCHDLRLDVCFECLLTDNGARYR